MRSVRWLLGRRARRLARAERLERAEIDARVAELEASSRF
jgi:hypothetical protein